MDSSFPRYVHGPEFAMRRVDDAIEYREAIAAGWDDQPRPVSVTQGDVTHAVYTADALTVALSQGWTRVDPPETADQPKKGRKK